MLRSFAALSTVFSVAFVLIAVPAAHAAPLYTLEDGDSTVRWDLGSNDGMYSWQVDNQGVGHQWFWYRVGDDTTPVTTSTNVEISYDTLPLTTSGVTDTNFDSLPDTLFATYANSEFSTNLTFKLTSGGIGSGTAAIAGSITIENLTGAPLPFHFYQYSNSDLGGPFVDRVAVISDNVMRQTDSLARISSETVVSPTPDHHEVSLTPTIRTKLDDALPTTLADNSSAGPGNVSWAFQWDFLIPAGESVTITSDTLAQVNVSIPEPSSLVLAAIAAAALAVPIARRRKRRR